MNSNQPAQEPRTLPLPVALLPILALVLIMGSAVLLFGADPHVPLLMSTIVAVIIGLIYGHKWKDLQNRIIEAVSSVSETVLILMLIGGLVAMWIVSGTVPAMVYYGLKIINPSFFLVTSCALCCIVSVACGSSWTTAATVGIALMGIGAGLGINPAMTAGSVVSGSFFGDRLSPLSDITNLTSAVTKVNLFEHIRHMIYTSVPALILALIIYFFLGLQYSTDSMDMSTITSMSQTLAANFDLNPILLLPPVLVVLMVVFRVPAIPGLVGGIALGGVFFVFFQGGLEMGFAGSFQTIIECINYGAVVETGDAFIDGRLARGGIPGMLYTVSLMICAMVFGGSLEQIGALRVVSDKLLNLAKGTGSLVLVTILSCILTNALTGDVYLSLMIPGRMYSNEYKKRGLQGKNLSRALEDGGAVSSCFFPWNACGSYMSSTLGVSCIAYVPFAFVNLITPIVSILFAYVGLTIAKMTKEEWARAKEELAEAGASAPTQEY